MVTYTKYVRIRVPQLKWTTVNGVPRCRVVYVTKSVPVKIRRR